ncbi:MAG TPA: hypothetical protein VJ488_00110 [Dehalococcoidia bacterium]|nr:hypothetical protein [Dehalococcoidia bacterium]
MVSTVTVSAITIVAASGLMTGLTIFAAVFLIGLLAGREILGASANNRHKFLGRCLTISIVPLVISFVVIVALKVVEILA